MPACSDTIGGLDRFIPSSGDFLRGEALALYQFGPLIQDGLGVIWVGTTRGLLRYDIQADAFSTLDALLPGYPPQAYALISEPNLHRIAGLSKVVSLADLSRSFRIERPARLLVVCAGEGELGGAIYDRGWIEEQASGTVFWSMDTLKAKHAGGAAKNLIQMEVVELPAGRYVLRYVSDDSHAFGSWNAPPPLHPELWGIQLYALSDIQENLFRGLPETPSPGPLPESATEAVLRDRRGDLWFGTHFGLYRYEVRAQRFSRYRSLSEGGRADESTKIIALAEDQDGVILAGTETEGLYRFDPNTGRSVNYTHRAGEAASLPHPMISCMMRDSAGRLWLGTYKGFCLYDLDRAARSPEDALLPAEDNRGEWPRRIQGLYQDRTGAIWISALEGLFRVDQEGLRFKQFFALPESDVTALLVSQEGDVWIGTYSRGLFRIGPKTGGQKHFLKVPGNARSLADNCVWSLLEDRQGVLWVGTKTALHRFDRAADRFVRFRHEPTDPGSIAKGWVFALGEDGTGRLWIGINDWQEPEAGLIYLAATLDRYEGNGKFVHYKQSSARPAEQTLTSGIHAIRRDAEGRIWIGTQNGLLQYLEDQDALQMQCGPGTLPGPGPRPEGTIAYVKAMEFDARGHLWIGAHGRLYEVEPGPECSVREFTSPDLSTLSIHDLVVDPAGALWMATFEGLVRITTTDRAIQRYAPKAGLRAWAYRRLALGKDGTVFAASGGPVEAFRPEDLLPDPRPPAVAIHSFKVFSKEMLPGGERSPLDRAILETDRIRLNHRQNAFSFEFTAFHYAHPEKNTYAYRMEGFDPEWVQCGTRRYAAYSNLRPGKYTFRVRAANCDGVWNEEGTSVAITILPPPWRTWWAYTLYGLFMLGAALAYNAYRNRRQKEVVERERMQRELDLARSIQKTFLPPSLPEVPGLTMAARIQMSMEVGGDLYGVFPIPGGVRVVVGDVSGKGVGGALYMAVAVSLLEDLTKGGHGPSATLAKLDGQLKERLGGKRFVTCVIADLDTARGTVRMANAGHLPPLVVREGAVRELAMAEPGPPLGTPLEAEYEEGEASLEKGSGLVFFTDGFPEAQAPGSTELLGFEGFEGWLKEAPAGPEAMAAALFDRLATYSRGALADDATLVVVEVV